MTGLDDGIGAPPVLQPHRAPGLTPGSVQAIKVGTLNATLRETAHWDRALATRAQSQAPPSFSPMPPGSDPFFKTPRSLLDQQVQLPNDGSTPGALDIVRDVAKLVWTMGTRPFASGMDESKVNEIKALQAQFMLDHGDQLRELYRNLADAKKEMAQIAESLEAGLTRLDSRKINALMTQKEYCGADVNDELTDALSRATDPDERARLQGLRNDLDAWKRDGNSRLEPERLEVQDLDRFKNRFTSQLRKQEKAMMNAANSPSQGTDAQTRPEAVRHVTSLHDFLLASKVEMDRTLAAR
jgi:hypothetical protein